MRDWIAAQLAAGLPAFAGSKLSGTLAVRQELLNEQIANWLAADSASTQLPSVDLRMLRATLKSATVRAEGGKLLIDIEICV